MDRRTGFREQYYTGTRNSYSAGKIGASNQVKLCMRFGWFFLDIFGLMCLFGLALFVVQDMVSLHVWELVWSPGKSICERLNGIKVVPHMVNVTEFWTRGLLRRPKHPSRTQERALTRNELHTWLGELASESNTIQAQGILTGQGRLELRSNHVKLCGCFCLFSCFSQD